MPGSNHPWGKIHGDRPRFTPITDDVLAGLFHLQANALERRLIGYVLHWSWGAVVKKGKKGGRFGDPQPCFLDAPALAEAWGISRTHLAEARASLLADSVLVPLGDGFTFNKDADSWKAGRITPESVEFARRMADSRPIGEGNGRTATVRLNGQSKTATVRKRAMTVPNCGQSKAPLSTPTDSRSASPIEEARASEEFKKIEEDNNKTRGGVAPIHREDMAETPSRPVDPNPAFLVADDIPAPSPSPAPPVATPSPDDRLADWCKAEVDRAYPDNEMPGEAIHRGVRQWRGAGVDRHVIAAYVSDACGVSFRAIRTDVPTFVRDKIRRHKEVDGLPPIPAEWAPEIRGPELHVPNPEFVAKYQAMKELAAKGIRPKLAPSFHEANRRRLVVVPPPAELAS